MTQHRRLVLRHGLSVQTGKVLNILLHWYCLRLLPVGANLRDRNEGSLYRWCCNARLGSYFARIGLLLIREKSKGVRCIEVLHRRGWLRLLGHSGGLRRCVTCLILGSTLILRLRLGSNSVLGWDLVILEESFEDLHALIFLLRLKKVGDVLDLVLNILALNLVLLAEDESGLDSLNLGFQESKSIWICDLEAWAYVDRQFFVRLAELIFSMGIGTILTEVALLFLLKVLADLRLIVVVRDVEHLVLDLNWELLKG